MASAKRAFGSATTEPPAGARAPGWRGPDYPITIDRASRADQARSPHGRVDGDRMIRQAVFARTCTQRPRSNPPSRIRADAQRERDELHTATDARLAALEEARDSLRIRAERARKPCADCHVVRRHLAAASGDR
jgi:hypothetical protein